VKLKNYLQLILAVFVILFGCITLIIAFQSNETISIINTALTRHVDQYLLERAVQAIVQRELDSQNTWLWLNGVLLIFAGSALLFFKPKTVD